eukprot:jgi/Mesvir1/28152/Mv26206-RA.2
MGDPIMPGLKFKKKRIDDAGWQTVPTVEEKAAAKKIKKARRAQAEQEQLVARQLATAMAQQSVKAAAQERQLAALQKQVTSLAEQAEKSVFSSPASSQKSVSSMRSPSPQASPADLPAKAPSQPPQEEGGIAKSGGEQAGVPIVPSSAQKAGGYERKLKRDAYMFKMRTKKVPGPVIGSIQLSDDEVTLSPGVSDGEIEMNPLNQAVEQAAAQFVEARRLAQQERDRKKTAARNMTAEKQLAAMQAGEVLHERLFNELVVAQGDEGVTLTADQLNSLLLQLTKLQEKMQATETPALPAHTLPTPGTDLSQRVVGGAVSPRVLQGKSQGTVPSSPSKPPSDPDAQELHRRKVVENKLLEAMIAREGGLAAQAAALQQLGQAKGFPTSSGVRQGEQDPAPAAGTPPATALAQQAGTQPPSAEAQQTAPTPGQSDKSKAVAKGTPVDPTPPTLKGDVQELLAILTAQLKTMATNPMDDLSRTQLDGLLASISQLERGRANMEEADLQQAVKTFLAEKKDPVKGTFNPKQKESKIEIPGLPEGYTQEQAKEFLFSLNYCFESLNVQNWFSALRASTTIHRSAPAIKTLVQIYQEKAGTPNLAIALWPAFMDELKHLLVDRTQFESIRGFNWLNAYQVNKQDYATDCKNYRLAVEKDPDLRGLPASYLLYSWLSNANLDKAVYATVVAGLKPLWNDFRAGMNHIQDCLTPLAIGAPSATPTPKVQQTQGKGQGKKRQLGGQQGGQSKKAKGNQPQGQPGQPAQLKPNQWRRPTPPTPAPPTPAPTAQPPHAGPKNKCTRCGTKGHQRADCKWNPAVGDVDLCFGCKHPRHLPPGTWCDRQDKAPKG